MINKTIEDWLENEKKDNYVHYYDLDAVTLDGNNFDLNDLKDKLLQSIVEEIEGMKKTPANELRESVADIHNQALDTLKAKLISNIKE